MNINLHIQKEQLVKKYIRLKLGALVRVGNNLRNSPVGPAGKEAYLHYKLDRDGNIVEWDDTKLGPQPTDEELDAVIRSPKQRAKLTEKEQSRSESELVRHIDTIVCRWRQAQDSSWQGNQVENNRPECRVVGGKREYPNNPVISGLPSGRRIVLFDHDTERFGTPPSLDDLIEIAKDVVHEKREKHRKQVRRNLLDEPIDEDDAEKMADKEAAEVCPPERYMRLLAAERAGDTKAAQELNTIDGQINGIQKKAPQSNKE